LWNSKKKWFSAASVLLVSMFLAMTYSGVKDVKNLNNPSNMSNLAEAKEILGKFEKLEKEYKALKADTLEAVEARGKEQKTLRNGSGFWHGLCSDINRAILETTVPDREIKVVRKFALASGQERKRLAGLVRSDQGRMELVDMLPFLIKTGSETNDGGTWEVNELRQNLIAGLESKPRSERKLLFLNKLESNFMENLNSEKLTREEDGFEIIRGASSSASGYIIRLQCRTPLAQVKAVGLVNDLRNKLIGYLSGEGKKAYELFGKVMEKYHESKSVEDKPDPFFNEESISNDFVFDLRMRIKIVNQSEGKTKQANKRRKPVR